MFEEKQAFRSLTLAVNHSGDSDSTGAIFGNAANSILFPGIVEPYCLTLEQAIDSGVLVVPDMVFNQIPNIAS